MTKTRLDQIMERGFDAASFDDIAYLGFVASVHRQLLRLPHCRGAGDGLGLSMVDLGLSKVQLRGRQGYDLAIACREAATRLEVMARRFEDSEDAHSFLENLQFHLVAKHGDRS